VAIDPGGSDPWGLVIHRIDEAGNIIVTDSFPQILNARPNQVYEWRDAHAPKDVRHVIDYENRVVMIQLQDEHDIVCEPAMKDVYAGIQQMASYFYPLPNTPLPVWYKDTQPAMFWNKFRDKGAPKFYVMAFKNGRRINEDWSKQHDNFVWDEKNPIRPKPGQADHNPDCSRYAIASRPEPAQPKPAAFLPHLKDDATTGGMVAKLVAKLKQEQYSEAVMHTDGDMSLSRDANKIGFIDEWM